MSFLFSSTMGNIDDVCKRSTTYLKSEVKGIEKLLFPINLVIREGLTNAVRHGNANDPEKKVRFLLTIVNHESIKLMIEDEGEGFDWRKQKSGELPEDMDHGRGIIIMDTYFTHYSYNDKGNILYLEKNIFFKNQGKSS
ncbi:MAG: ATP-binding protein [Deltaproteobacteria bacterium]|nr:ATP-binding protein [Deltaproteobacteria bacterium]